jgi:hypothetical protein
MNVDMYLERDMLVYYSNKHFGEHEPWLSHSAGIPYSVHENRVQRWVFICFYLRVGRSDGVEGAGESVEEGE